MTGPPSVGPPTLFTVTFADPEAAPLAAVTLNVPALDPAANTPVGDMLPPPFTLHVNAGAAANGCANWSYAIAENACVPPLETVALGGVTPIVVCVGVTVTVTLLVAVAPSASAMVARSA
jgi:hypothetical protein